MGWLSGLLGHIGEVKRVQTKVLALCLRRNELDPHRSQKIASVFVCCCCDVQELYPEQEDVEVMKKGVDHVM